MEELDLGYGAEQMTESTAAASDVVSLEAALQEELEHAAPLVKQAGRLLSALKGWQKAASVGNVLARDKHSQQALALGEELAARVAAAASHWGFDTARYLDSSRWREELTAAGAEKHGLRMTIEGDYLLSPPVVVRALPGASALKIGKKRWQNLRPHVVTEELKRIREASLSATSHEFLECLYQYAKRYKSGSNPLVLFREAYDAFCLAPGYRKETSKADFGLSIYSLHRSQTRSTRAGIPFEFAWPAANRRESDVFTVIAEDGTAIRYYGIQFLG